MVAEARQGRTWPASWFRWALSVVTVIVVARILEDWFGRRQYLRQRALSGHTRFSRSFTSYVIIHTNSSLLTHICLAAVIALGALQIALVWVWHGRLARRWWLPPLIEVALCAAFAVVAAQALEHYWASCSGGSDSPYHCTVGLPNIVRKGWIEIWIAAGLGIGFLWSFDLPPVTGPGQVDPLEGVRSASPHWMREVIVFTWSHGHCGQDFIASSSRH